MRCGEDSRASAVVFSCDGEFEHEGNYTIVGIRELGIVNGK
jgi:hypothetical protein